MRTCSICGRDLDIMPVVVNFKGLTVCPECIMRLHMGMVESLIRSEELDEMVSNISDSVARTTNILVDKAHSQYIVMVAEKDFDDLGDNDIQEIDNEDNYVDYDDYIVCKECNNYDNCHLCDEDCIHADLDEEDLEDDEDDNFRSFF